MALGGGLQAVLPHWNGCQMLGRFPPSPCPTWTGCPLKHLLVEVLSTICLVHLESTKLKLLL